jgi:hypothetical protein
VNEEDETAAPRNFALAILRYVDRYPEAKDTIEGITQWWLRRERSTRVLRDVEGAVAWLLAHDFLLETRRPGVPPYYWLNPQRRAEIATMLKCP